MSDLFVSSEVAPSESVDADPPPARHATPAPGGVSRLPHSEEPEGSVRTQRVSIRILGQSGPRPHRPQTSLLICKLHPSVDLRGWRGGKPLSVSLPDGRPVRLSSTPCHFGGVRWWLICPKCDRRCQVIYGTECRLCRGAVHETAILSPVDRLREKALKIRRRLGQTSGGLLAPFPPRPKHMRWATYWQLRLECRHVEQTVIRAMADAIGLTLPSEETEELFVPKEAFHEEP